MLGTGTEMRYMCALHIVQAETAFPPWAVIPGNFMKLSIHEVEVVVMLVQLSLVVGLHSDFGHVSRDWAGVVLEAGCIHDASFFALDISSGVHFYY